MPEKTQAITVNGFDKGSLQALAYGTLESLGWTIKYAGEKAVVAYTAKSWNKHSNEITVETADNQLTITSKMIHGESFDMMGKNKKFIEEFIQSFNAIKPSAGEGVIAGWKEKVATLKEQTIKIAQEEIKEASEVDKVMNLSKSNLYATYGIMVINVIVFIAMAASGISILQPTGLDVIRWGANFSPLTLSGDWWRLISCVFVHIGIVHILFNMYALYMVGVYLEPMLGKAKYVVAYLCTGVFASLTSLWWHKTPIASAGASGAIFGMYGVFLALLISNLIPKQIRDNLLKSIAIFIGYNLLYGMKSGVDNSAHIGGLLSGLIIGYGYFLTMKKEQDGNKRPAILLIVSAATIVIAYLYLQNNQASKEERNATTEVVNESKYKDGQKFLEGLNNFSEMENKAVAPFRDTAQLMDASLIKRLDENSLPKWNKAEQLIEEMKSYDVSENSKKKIEMLGQYVQLRKEQIEMIKKDILEKNDVNNKGLNEITGKLNKLLDELNGL